MNMDTSHQLTLALQATLTMARRLLWKPLQESGPALIAKSLEGVLPSRSATQTRHFINALYAPHLFAIVLNPNALIVEEKVSFSE
jgi:hypothetical protein